MAGSAAVLRGLPQSGPLFPYLRRVRAGDRSTEFKQRCVGLGITGVSLHSYRYAWAHFTLEYALANPPNSRGFNGGWDISLKQLGKSAYTSSREVPRRTTSAARPKGSLRSKGMPDRPTARAWIVGCVVLVSSHRGEDSPRATEAVEHLLSPELRPALRQWYQRWGDGMNENALCFRDRLSELAGERFG